MVRSPTVTCFSGPTSPPSVTSTGRLRTLTSPMSAADAAKVVALSKTVSHGSASSSTPAPMAGPATTQMLSTVLRRAFAEPRSRSGTSCGVIAAAAGS